MEKVKALILAAGESKCKNAPRLMQNVCGKPMLEWVVDAAAAVSTEKPCLVVDGGEAREYFGGECEYALQQERLGSGHAAACAGEYIGAFDGTVLIIAGDMPLITEAALKAMLEAAKGEKAAIATAVLKNPSGYGRIIRDAEGGILRIAEEAEATDEEKKITEVNLSLYCCDAKLLKDALSKIKPENTKHEYYLTDVVETLVRAGFGVSSVPMDIEDALGVNTFSDLACACEKLRRRINERLMLSGVTIMDPKSAYIDATVRVGQGSVIYPNVILEGNTSIGENAVIYQGCRIADSSIGEGATVQSSVILSSSVGKNTNVGPYAYLRPQSHVGDGCKVGDFVEIKNSTVGDGSKIPHLSYIGDGKVGEKTNIGCGVIFVNYDSVKKHRTLVGDGCFIGCNANLVAPVSVGDGSYIAAGSTITEDVPENTLALGRARQVNKPGWVSVKERSDD